MENRADVPHQNPVFLQRCHGIFICVLLIPTVCPFVKKSVAPLRVLPEVYLKGSLDFMYLDPILESV